MLQFDELTPSMIASMFGNCRQRIIDVQQLLGCGLDNKEVIRLLDERDRRSKAAAIEAGVELSLIPASDTVSELYNSYLISAEEEAIAARQQEKLSSPQLKVVSKIMGFIPIDELVKDCENCPCAAEITLEERARLRKESWR